MRNALARAGVLAVALIAAFAAACSLTAPSDDELMGGGAAGDASSADVSADVRSDVPAEGNKDVSGDATITDSAKETATDVVVQDHALDQPIPIDVVCGVTEKVCGAACVSKNDPLFGCTETGCTPCGIQHAAATCLAGKCQMGVCDQDWGDCDQDLSNGCETSLATDPGHCGQCTTSCSFENATAQCKDSTCALGTCTTGWGNCDVDPSNGCEMQVVDPQHCGSCTNQCQYAHATAECVNAQCALGDCSSGWRDCDSDPANGCESSVLTDVQNCGTCGHVCQFPNAAAGCTNGTCVLGACAQGFGNCDGNATNGCETATANDPKNCGNCGTICPTPAHTTPTCTASTCHTTCLPDWADCDNQPQNGCEADLLSSVQHCGTCGHACSGSAPHSSPACLTGTCGLVCATMYGDCDGSIANGCETSLWFDSANCGACGRQCASCLQAVCPATELATENQPSAITLGGSMLYFATRLDGMSVPKAGGASTELESFGWNSGLAGVAVDSSNAYWAVGNQGTLVKDALVPGSSGNAIVTGVAGIWGVAVDTTRVFFTVPTTNGTVQRVLKDGTGKATIASNQDMPRGVAVDDTYVYWVNQGSGTVQRADLATFTVTTLVTGQAGPYAIAADGTLIFWTNLTGDSIMRAKRDGTGIVTLASNQDSPSAIALDSSNVYWVNDTSTGSVRRVAKTGGNVVTIATNQDHPRGVATDGSMVFWTEYGNNTVWRAQK